MPPGENPSDCVFPRPPDQLGHCAGEPFATAIAVRNLFHRLLFLPLIKTHCAVSLVRTVFLFKRRNVC